MVVPPDALRLNTIWLPCVTVTWEIFKVVLLCARWLAVARMNEPKSVNDLQPCAVVGRGHGNIGRA